MSPKLARSKIAEIEELDGVTYRWDRPDAKFLRRLIGGIGLVQFGVLFGFALPVMIGQKGQQGAAPDEAAFILAIFGTVVLLAATMFYFLVRKGLPERVTLGRDTFRYDPGRQPAVAIWFNPWLAMKYPVPSELFTLVLRRRRHVEQAKEELVRVVLDRAGERQRLYFDLGADRIEIGECSREPEREWLTSVIQEWHYKER